MPGRSLLVLDVTEGRADGAFTEALHQLTDGVVRTARAQGWDVTVLAVGDAPASILDAAVAGSAAVVLMGGEDVDPDCYGGPRDYPGAGGHQRLADDRSIALVRAAVGDGRPLLGICRGLQLIDVALGGTLVQHLDDAAGHRERSDPPYQAMARHEVRWVEPGSALAGALGPEPITVLSSHHQAIDRVGAGLAVVGVAPDGVVEAVEHETAPVYGVQWHPERTGSDPAQLVGLLAVLADAVDQRAGRSAQPGPSEPAA